MHDPNHFFNDLPNPVKEVNSFLQSLRRKNQWYISEPSIMLPLKTSTHNTSKILGSKSIKKTYPKLVNFQYYYTLRKNF